MKWLMRLLKVAFACAILGVGGAIGLYFYLAPGLPDVDSLREIQLQEPLRIFSRDRKLIAEFGEKRRIPLSFEQLPQPLVQAFLAAEDDRFFEHPGVDYQGLIRAVMELVLTGEKRQGGSTITMQLARNFFLSPEKTYTRKLNEILLALRIEHNLSKEEIMELYLNKIYLGNRAYGVGAAANIYYNKGVSELTLAQTAMIAGLPKAPSRTNPIANPEKATHRRNYVLGRMHQLGFISDAAYAEASEQPASARLHLSDIEAEAPFVAEMARMDLMGRFGDQAYSNGYRVITSIDSGLQQKADAALRQALQEYDLRHGYRGPEKRFELEQHPDAAAWDALLADYPAIGDLRAALITAVAEKSATAYLGNGEQAEIPWDGLKWARPYGNVNYRKPLPATADGIVSPGDLVRVLLITPEKEEQPGYWRLAQIPAVTGALIALDPDNGAIRALSGGYDFGLSKFNRAVQAKRQPGSGFKPFIYSAALETGFTPASLIDDAPVVIDDPSLEGKWRPQNYSRKFSGPIRLRYALTKSINLVSIRLLRAMGMDHALSHVANFGFDPDALPRNLSLALGSCSVTPLQMSKGYAVLANGGFRVEPYLIESIDESGEQVVYLARPATVCEGCPQPPGDGTTEAGLPIAPRVISAENAFLMNSMLRDVVRHGTGHRAMALGRNDLAGKTGTTNDQRDAWFNGFNRKLVANAWVGFDSNAKLGRGEVGGRAALPAWMYFMQYALKDISEQPLKMPPGIIQVRIDPDSGKLAYAGQENAISEYFRRGNAPVETAARPLGPDEEGELSITHTPTNSAEIF